jgi:hypothetical protein
MANVIQADPVVQLLVEKDIFSEQEFSTKLKQVQTERENKGSVK